jgi:hypothetical protein
LGYSYIGNRKRSNEDPSTKIKPQHHLRLQQHKISANNPAPAKTNNTSNAASTPSKSPKLSW